MNKSIRNLALVPAVMAVSAFPALAQTTPTGAETAITDAQTTILALVGVAGAAMVAVALAMVGWTVAVKFVKKLRGAA